MSADQYGWTVKVKEPGMKRWEFLGGAGHLTTCRVHAVMISKAVAEEAAAQIEAKYPDTRARAVRFGR